MKFGIHLPQIGNHVTAELIGQAARDAEDLGYDSIWVNDHLAIPDGAPYPPAEILEPLIMLTWAAACTSKVAIGTSVLLLALRHPVHLAKELATLDILSGQRLIVGAGVGWLKEEFEALGIPFSGRGAYTDECIKLLRACWQEDPVTTEADLIPAVTKNIRTLPQPNRDIPIWVGGNSKAAIERAKKFGQGWHGLATRLTVDDLRPIVADLRANTGPDFRITVRTFWDALKDDNDELKATLEAYADMGINGVISEPRQRDVEKRRKAVEAMLELSQPWQTRD